MQAAVGGTALDIVNQRNLGPVARDCAEMILTLSAVLILATAPIGAAGTRRDIRRDIRRDMCRRPECTRPTPLPARATRAGIAFFGPKWLSNDAASPNRALRAPSLDVNHK